MSRSSLGGYSQYKSTEVDWLDSLPSHWTLPSTKMMIDVRDGTHDTPAYVEKSDLSFPLVTSKDVTSGHLLLGGCKHISRVDYLSIIRRSKVDSGDILMPMIGTVGSPIIVGKSKDFAIKNLALFKTSKCSVIATSFINYFLQSNECEIQFQLEARGGVQNFVSLGTLRDLKFPFPPMAEQQKIANFLDHETTKIDTLIEKQQQLIKLLKEKRQAVISHAVTKGLNPNAPMRDSGVEWLGEVPEHWEVKRLKHVSPKIGVGLVINPSTYTIDEGVYFIFGGDVKEYSFDLSSTRRMSKENSDQLLPSRLNHRDLVSIRVGYPGVTAVVPEELEGANCASVIIIRRGDFNSDWLCAAMNVWVGRQQVDLASYGAAQKQFNVSDAIDFVFPVPPPAEQDQIANHVQKSLERFGALITKAEWQIDLLKERRTALISAAVTGKIDVRDWQPPAGESANYSSETQEEAAL
ncbi:MAG: restriction endonuclease subunit S [Hahellaceae bacterium]|nr:restriction endonuclease subunit S [Hahellaceae bacterium]MCP5170569.1 restriction endonuclease subunit S [Hahellaceae bacterium]